MMYFTVQKKGKKEHMNGIKESTEGIGLTLDYGQMFV